MPKLLTSLPIEAMNPEQGELLLTDPRSFVDPSGDVLPSATAANDVVADTDYAVTDLSDVLPVSVPDQEPLDTNEVLKRTGDLVLREWMPGENPQDVSEGVTSEGDLVSIDPDEDFDPQPIVQEATHEEQSPEELLDSFLRKDGYGHIADEIKRLGVGLVEVSDLDRPAFRGNLTDAQFAAYLLELGGFNGQLREAVTDSPEYQDEVPAIPPVLREVMAMYYSGKSYSLADRAKIADAADRIITSRGAFVTRDEEASREIRKLHNVAHIRKRTRELAQPHFGKVRVLEANSGPVLVCDIVEQV